MSAENILFLLDECDELNVLLHESMRPAVLSPLLFVALAVLVGWLTQSVAVGVGALVAVAWSALVLAWLAERLAPNAHK